MTHAERSDARLVELSRQGLASAFGVLVHRHGHLVLQLTQDDDDPVGATVAIFIRAMRTLSDADLDDVRGWLVNLTAIELGRSPDALVSAAGSGLSPGPDPGAHAGAGTLTETLDPRLDEVWAELAPRWPTGRRPRHLPSWAIWVGTTIVLLALAVLLPWAVLGSLGNGEPAVRELRASPVLDDIEVEDEPIVEEDAEPLPTFDFPEPPGDGGSGDPGSTGSSPDAEPEPDPSPPSEDPLPDEDADDDGTTGDEPVGDGDTGNDGTTGDDTGGDAPTSDEQDPAAPEPDDDPDASDPDVPDTDPVGTDPPADDPADQTTDESADGEPTTGTDT